MNLEEAKTFLEDTSRHELRDHAFGDMEVTWLKGSLKKDGDVLKEIAHGYSGSSMVSVTIITEDGTVSFSDDDARSLMSCGTLGTVGRNDETGPDEFVEGKIMPGLTLEGVREELTGG